MGALLLIAWVLTLPGCGFRLRGAAVLPPAMERTHLTGTPRHGALGMEIAATLARAGGRLVDEPAGASAVLQILGEGYDRRVLAVDANRRVSEYELSYQLDFELRGPEGEVVVPAQSVRLTRAYSFDSAAVLAKSEEEELLRREMRASAVRQMLRRLQTAGTAADR